MIVCHCKKCDSPTRHRDTDVTHMLRCAVCGTLRCYCTTFGAGDFPELAHDENEIVHEARACGFGACFAAIPNATAQAQRTLEASRKWLETRRLN